MASTYGVPQVDFSQLGAIGDNFIAARRQAQRDQILSNSLGPDGTVDFGKVMSGLVSAGDIEGASRIAQIANANDTRQLAREQFKNTQYVQSPGYIEQKARTEARVANEFAPKTTNIKDQNGNEYTVEKGPNGYQIPNVQGAPGEPTNPYAFGKQNESQSKDSGYADRMFRAETVLRDPKVQDAATSLKQNVMGMAPGFASNYLTSSDYQKFDQAKRDFVNAVLRRESGAAISQSEFDNAHKQYFPQPGDTPERIAEKQRNRQDAIAGVAGGGGQSYRPPYTFDEKGQMVSTGRGPRGQAKPAQPRTFSKDEVSAARSNPQQTINDAKAAIANGADRNAVINRLRQLGVNPSGL